MVFEFTQMTLEYASQIKSWGYEDFIKEVCMDSYFDSYCESLGNMIGPGGAEDYAALSNGELVGMFEFTLDDDAMEISLAIAPNLVGKGYGRSFVEQGIAFGVKHYKYKKSFVKLSVGIDNKAAIRVYETIGFVEVARDATDIEMRLYL